MARTGFSRESTKGLTYPLLPGSAGADVTALVDSVNDYIHEQWATNRIALSALIYGYKGGVFFSGAAQVRVNDGTVPVDDNTINYVERDSAGVVSSNTTGFSATKTPMAKVTTANGAITAIEDWRPMGESPGAGGSGIGGSGTANKVAKFTATHTIGNSQITDDGAFVVVGTDPGGGEFLRVGGSMRVSGSVTMLALLTLMGGLTVSAGAITLPTSSLALPALESFGAAGGYLRSDGTAWTRASPFDILGTSNQVAVASGTGTVMGANVTVSLTGPYTPTTYTAHGVLVGEGTSSIVALSVGTTGQVLVGNSGANPSWSTLSGIAVTSITGTANQITASASTGAVTLSLPSAVTMPGSLTVSTDLTITNGLLTITRTSSTAQLLINTTAGGAGESLNFIDSGGTSRNFLFFPGSNVTALVNRGATSQVQIRANNSTAGAAGESTIATFTVASGVVLAPSVNFQMGDATHAGGDIVQYYDVSGNKWSIVHGANLTFVQNSTTTLTLNSGGGVVSVGQFLGTTGSNTAPSFAFSAATGTGFDLRLNSGADQRIGFDINGSRIMSLALISGQGILYAETDGGMDLGVGTNQWGTGYFKGGVKSAGSTFGGASAGVIHWYAAPSGGVVDHAANASATYRWLDTGQSNVNMSLTNAGNLTVRGTTTFNGLAYTWPGSQTNGYVLQTNGSGTLSWVPGGGTVTGTGTATYLAQWSSSTALTASNVFDDGTSVGVEKRLFYVNNNTASGAGRGTGLLTLETGSFAGNAIDFYSVVILQPAGSATPRSGIHAYAGFSDNASSSSNYVSYGADIAAGTVFSNVGSTWATVAGLHIGTGTVTGSSPAAITNNYGILIEAVTAGSTNYAIKTLGGTVTFLGSGVVVGVATGGDKGAGTVNLHGGLYFDGTKVVGAQGALIADASGGSVQDSEARTAINALLARLRTHGLIAT